MTTHGLKYMEWSNFETYFTGYQNNILGSSSLIFHNLFGGKGRQILEQKLHLSHKGWFSDFRIFYYETSIFPLDLKRFYSFVSYLREIYGPVRWKIIISNQS